MATSATCPRCNVVTREGARFCEACGAPLPAPPAVPVRMCAPQAPLAAIVLPPVRSAPAPRARPAAPVSGPGPHAMTSAPDRPAVLPTGAGPQMDHRPPRGGCLRRFGWLALVAVAGLVLALVDYRLLLRLLPFVSFALMGYSVFVILRTFRVPRKVPYFGLLFAVFTSIASMVVYYEIYAARDSGFRNALNGQVMLPAIGIGLAVGFVWSWTVRLTCEHGRVMSRGNVWYLVVWMAIFAFTQLIPALTSRPPRLGIILMAFSAGMLFANNLMLVFRAVLKRLFWKPPPPVRVAEGGAG